jgi:hypothetical protein
VETSSGAKFEINKRFSDFEALHNAYIAPVPAPRNIYIYTMPLRFKLGGRPILSARNFEPVVSRVFPFGLERRQLGKNERQVVTARKVRKCGPFCAIYI